MQQTIREPLTKEQEREIAAGMAEMHPLPIPRNDENAARLKEPDALDTPDFHELLLKYREAEGWIKRTAAMQSIKAYVRKYYKAV